MNFLKNVHNQQKSFLVRIHANDIRVSTAFKNVASFLIYRDFPFRQDSKVMSCFVCHPKFALWKEKRKNKRTCSAWPRARIFRLLGFLSLQNAQTIVPTTVWTAVSSRNANTRDSFLPLSGLGHAPCGRTMERTRPNEHSQGTGQPSSAD